MKHNSLTAPILPKKKVIARIDSAKNIAASKKQDTTTATTSGTTCGFAMGD